MLRFKNRHKGKGFINSAIDFLGQKGVDLTLPTYFWCGPGTDVAKNLREGVQSKNLLDSACKEHDLAFYNSKDPEVRRKADKVLIEKAWSRVTDKNTPLEERLTSYLVTNLMKAKVAMGGGLRKSLKNQLKRKEKTPKKHCSGGGFPTVLQKIKKTLKKSKEKDIPKAIKIAIDAGKSMKTTKTLGPRIIPIPKTGGILQYLVPILAGLSSIGAIADDAKSILQTIENIKNARKGSGIVKVDKNLIVAPFKKGYGLYLRPYNPYEEAKNS